MSQFPIGSLRTIIGGTSAIDLEGLQVSDLQGAERFLESYGFDWSRPRDRSEIERMRRRAVRFIEEDLLDPSEQIAPSVRQQEDVRELLVCVSTDRRSVERLWACALLRVMHTVAHCASDMSMRFGTQIRAQVIAPFEQSIRTEAHGAWLGDVPIHRFETRPQKSESSLVMKLLQKPRHVAADVFDRVGVRFVTHDRLDALRVIRYLREHYVIMFANIKPSRSRNSLVDLDRFEALLDSGVSDAELASSVETWPYPDDKTGHVNPYSSREYRAIQFTGRQRVRVPDGVGGELRFFFPFEVQIMDRASYDSSRVGWASHEAYKERQRQASRARVLRGLLQLAPS